VLRLAAAKTAAAPLEDQSTHGPFSRVEHADTNITGDIAEAGGTAEFEVNLFETLNIRPARRPAEWRFGARLCGDAY